jgi:hypothetical protein
VVIGHLHDGNGKISACGGVAGVGHLDSLIGAARVGGTTNASRPESPIPNPRVNRR